MRFFNHILFMTHWTMFTTIMYAQNQNASRVQGINEFLNILKEDMYVGGGTNFSGVYMSKYRTNTNMSLGMQGFVGFYFPYTDNLFFHGQLGMASQNFTHTTPNEQIQVTLSSIELPIFVSALLPISTKLETRLIVGWQGNWIFRTKNSAAYSPEWSSNPNSILYNPERMMTHDFGFYFGIGAEYGRWLVRATGYTGINNLVKNDTGMINTWKFDVGYFIFRK